MTKDYGDEFREAFAQSEEDFLDKVINVDITKNTDTRIIKIEVSSDKKEE